MRCETMVGTEKCRQLISVNLLAINYKHGICCEITYFNQRAKRVQLKISMLHLAAHAGCKLYIDTHL